MGKHMGIIQDEKPARKSHTAKDCLKGINAGIPRLDKAFQILDKVTLTTVSKAQVLASDGVTLYNVDYVENTCTCPDYAIRGQICKHIRASKIKASQKAPTLELPGESGLVDRGLLNET